MPLLVTARITNSRPQPPHKKTFYRKKETKKNKRKSEGKQTEKHQSNACQHKNRTQSDVYVLCWRATTLFFAYHDNHVCVVFDTIERKAQKYARVLDWNWRRRRRYGCHTTICYWRKFSYTAVHLHREFPIFFFAIKLAHATGRCILRQPKVPCTTHCNAPGTFYATFHDTLWW